MQPDLAGFRAAQKRLIDEMGVDAVFVHEGASTYDSDVPTNPNTGQPYDPFATPAATAPARRETIRCGVVARVSAAQGDTLQAPIGMMSNENAALLMDLADMDRARGADRVELEGEVYDLRSLDRDDIGSRAIAYLEHA